jgi:hypothetical protein
MLLERRLRLITPILAAKRSNDPAAPRRVFVRHGTPKGEPADKVYINSDLKRWEWAFLEARDELGFGDVCLGAVLPSHWYAAHHTSTYNRKIRLGRERAVEQFESIPAGHTIRINFTLSRHLPPNTDGIGRFTRAPDEMEFDEMLAYIGEHLGMSEWGHALKLGRFELRPPANDGAATDKGADAESSAAPATPDNSYDFDDD